MESAKLFRLNVHGDWVVLKNPVSIHLLEGEQVGILVRDKSNNSLLADFPASSISRVDKATENIILIDSCGARIALELSNPFKTQELLAMMKHRKFPGIHASCGIDPTFLDLHMLRLEDPQVQEVVLKLLFHDDFREFVKELKLLLLEIKSKLEL